MTTDLIDEIPAPEADEESLARDIQMKLPDCLWQLDYTSRYAAGKFNEDFAALETGERFLFGVIEIPFADEPGSFTWGVWAEVAPGDHDAYLRDFQTPAAAGRKVRGTLANDIPGSPDGFGAAVELTLHADRRPAIRVLEGSLAELQGRGMTAAEHEALDRELFGDDDFEEDEEEGSVN
ncbi:DUF2199 domain-containing protein [Sutterella sp.]|uniref:DUF2199 domain-containing protein n=1 Tax=Sutterella sp. TaxID=1981025 RepID=UPI0026DF0EAB|nr:DUF2199 domain-containing protein [Sutterella sp.]MDO5532774.1 DUF2199 domain-containing protein [Sutterella sp.]